MYKAFLFTLIGVIAVCATMYFLMPEYSNGPYHPRGPGLNLRYISSCVETGIDSGKIIITEEDYGTNLNSLWLRDQLAMIERCRGYFNALLTTEERMELPLPSIAFDESLEMYVDDLGHPLYIIYFGDKKSSCPDAESNRLARRYRIAVWIVGTDGVNRFGASDDGKFYGITRQGDWELRPYESVWWRFWH